MGTSLVLLLALLGSVLAAPTASAAPSDRPGPPDHAAAHRDAPPPAQADRYDEAASEAARKGRTLLEIELTVPWGPEADLDDAQAGSQRARIAQARAEVKRAMRGTPHRIVSELDALPYLTVSASPETVEALRGSPDVADLVEPLVLRPLGQPSSADDLAQVSPAAQRSTELIGAEAANAAGATGAGQLVAVIDTGVETSHPALVERIVEEACFSATGDCAGGATVDIGPGSGTPCTFAAQCSHGTGVAGLAVGSEGSTIGVAPEAGLVAINAASRGCAGGTTCAVFSHTDIVAALGHVGELGEELDIAAVNLSMGSGRYTSSCDGVRRSYDDAVANLVAAGIAVVAASGNGGYNDSLSWPGCQSGTISVGNTTLDDTVHLSSNGADALDLYAPGSGVVTAGLGGTYTHMTGTSMSAPQVAAAFALLAEAEAGEVGAGDGSGDGVGAPEAGSVVAARLAQLRATGVGVHDRRLTPPRTTPRLDVAAALGLAPIAPQPPVNDALVHASRLTSGQPSATGTNVDASVEPGEPDHLGESSHSVWWSWTAPTTGSYRFTTEGSGFDTVLAVYRGASISTLVPVAAAASGAEGLAAVTFDVTQGTTYRLAVDGVGGATGDVVLQGAPASGGPGDGPPPATPAPGGLLEDLLQAVGDLLDDLIGGLGGLGG